MLAADANCLGGLVVKHPPGGDRPGFESCLSSGDFSRLGHTCDLEIGTKVAATLPIIIGSALETGWPSVGILLLDEIASLIRNFYLSMTACTVVRD